MSSLTLVPGRPCPTCGGPVRAARLVRIHLKAEHDSARCLCGGAETSGAPATVLGVSDLPAGSSLEALRLRVATLERAAAAFGVAPAGSVPCRGCAANLAAMVNRAIDGELRMTRRATTGIAAAESAVADPRQARADQRWSAVVSKVKAKKAKAKR